MHLTWKDNLLAVKFTVFVPIIEIRSYPITNNEAIVRIDCCITCIKNTMDVLSQQYSICYGMDAPEAKRPYVRCIKRWKNTGWYLENVGVGQSKWDEERASAGRQRCRSRM